MMPASAPARRAPAGPDPGGRRARPTIIAGMAFAGWAAGALDFYDGLEEDNSKAYWQAHKAVYEQAVLRPMEELLAEVEGQLGAGRIFRPYRDLRFSADKSPYKTAMAAAVGGDGYIQFSAAGLAAGRGRYLMDPAQLQRYRRAVDAAPSGPDLARIVAAARTAGVEVTARDRLKTGPRGFPRDHPRTDLLSLKGLIAWKQWPAGKWLATAQAKPRLLEFFASAGPLADWLEANVGPGP
jgi:uncharacterized protein (TIGR02453 family)